MVCCTKKGMNEWGVVGGLNIYRGKVCELYNNQIRNEIVMCCGVAIIIVRACLRYGDVSVVGQPSQESWVRN